jgi:hypothetical protein
MKLKAEAFNTSPLNLSIHNEGLRCLKEEAALKTSGAIRNGTK